MSDWFSTAMAFQQEILAAQKTQIEATRRLLDVGTQMTDAQEAGRKAAEAQARAFRAWAGLWGWK